MPLIDTPVDKPAAVVDEPAAEVVVEPVAEVVAEPVAEVVVEPAPEVVEVPATEAVDVPAVEEVDTTGGQTGKQARSSYSYVPVTIPLKKVLAWAAGLKSPQLTV